MYHLRKLDNKPPPPADFLVTEGEESDSSSSSITARWLVFRLTNSLANSSKVRADSTFRMAWPMSVTTEDPIRVSVRLVSLLRVLQGTTARPITLSLLKVT